MCLLPSLIRQLGDVSGGQPVRHHVARARVLVRLPWYTVDMSTLPVDMSTTTVDMSTLPVDTSTLTVDMSICLHYQ